MLLFLGFPMHPARSRRPQQTHLLIMGNAAYEGDTQ